MGLGIVIMFSETIMNLEVTECRPGNSYIVGAYPHGGLKVCKAPNSRTQSSVLTTVHAQSLILSLYLCCLSVSYHIYDNLTFLIGK